MEYEVKNPRRRREDMIDVEWNHPSFGWIPFTCVNAHIDPWKDEPDYMMDIWDGIMRGDFGPILDFE